MMRAPALIPLGLFLILATSSPAAAQSRHDTSAPIDFGAQHIELLDREKRVILAGNVVITQAEMRLTAPRMTLNYTGEITDGTPEVSRLDAAGGVTVVRPDQSARAQYAVYDLNRRVITMVGGVTLTQGSNTLRGNRLSIDLDTGRASIDGSAAGSSQTPGTQSQNGRVTGRFSVPKRATNGNGDTEGQ